MVTGMIIIGVMVFLTFFLALALVKGGKCQDDVTDVPQRRTRDHQTADIVKKDLPDDAVKESVRQLHDEISQGRALLESIRSEMESNRKFRTLLSFYDMLDRDGFWEPFDEYEEQRKSE